MLNITKSTMLNGTITLENTVAVSLYATKTQKGDVNLSVNIQSETLYQANKKECDEGIAEFKKEVEAI